MSLLNDFSLHGQTAVVTGGGRGLGYGIAEGLCQAGASVVLIGSSNKVFEAARCLNSQNHNAFAVQGDLSQADNISTIFISALNKLGGSIDILVNNAGLQRRHKCEDFPAKDWNDVLQVNLNAVFYLCQLAGRNMLAQGHGKIINMASMLSFFGGFTVPAYAASKGAVAQLTKALANEWTSKGINVNAIAPGYMSTEMNTNLINDKNRNAEILARIPAGRWGSSDDVKGLAVFLASKASDYISGAIIPVDGGYLCK